MTLSTIISMIVGVFLPLLVAAITRDALPEKYKVLILAFLSAVSGALTSVLGALPTTLTGWEHVALRSLVLWFLFL
jgi:hypothetical protein